LSVIEMILVFVVGGVTGWFLAWVLIMVLIARWECWW
jgi:hypothetical protein